MLMYGCSIHDSEPIRKIASARLSFCSCMAARHITFLHLPSESKLSRSSAGKLHGSESLDKLYIFHHIFEDTGDGGKLFVIGHDCKYAFLIRIRGLIL